MANLYLLEQADKLSNLRLTKEQIIDAIQEFVYELDAVNSIEDDNEVIRASINGGRSAITRLIRRLHFLDNKEKE